MFFKHLNRPPSKRKRPAGAILGLSTMFATLATFAALPPAGSIVGNQATATYTDSSSEQRTATSNLVETVVQQVAGVDIEADTSKVAAVGGTVYFPHTIENTGNGIDSYDLSGLVDANTGNITFTSLAVYPDADKDGIPDNFTPITITPAMASGETYGIVVAAQTPSDAASGDVETITVPAVSSFDAGITDFNTDTVTVTSNAVIEVTKAMNVSSGPTPNGNPGDANDPITITLTYTNSGNDTATAVTLTDNLPAGMSYVDDSGRWSASAGTQLGDAPGPLNDPTGIDYAHDAATANVTAIIAAVAPGDSGSVTFDVTIDSGLAPGDIDNIARFAYEDGSGTAGTPNVAPVDTNTATYTVRATAGVVAIDVGNTLSSATDSDALANDIVTADAVAQGATVAFQNIIRNAGNGSDTFEVSVDRAGSTFPAGTTFLLYQADGATPMTDSNGDGNPDTGVIAADQEIAITVVAVLPPGASGDNAGGGFDVVMTATSALDPTQSDIVTDRLNAITDSAVDLTNDIAVNNGALAADGLGAGAETAFVRSASVDPGASTVFSLVVNNTSGVADGYDLASSSSPGFANFNLPAGWGVVFTDASGAVITNSGVIPAGQFVEVFATVTTADGYAPGPEEIYFRILSPTTGATDIIHDNVTINTIRGIELTLDNSGQAFPGSSQVYPHYIANNGNVAETSGAITSSDSSAANGWASVIYYDANGDGVIDQGDPVVDDIADFGGIAAGESVPLLIKVFAPAGANPGDSNSTTVTANFDAGGVVISESATDVTTVITGDVVLEKLQALDAQCDGTADGAFQSASITTGAVPGACLVYQITALNTGAATVTGVTVNDATPSFTSYEECAAGACAASGTTGAGAAATLTLPADESGGVVVADMGVLNPSESAQLTFTVQIDSQ